MIFKDKTPIEAFDEFKKNLLKYTLNYDLYKNYWYNTNFNGKIVETLKWMSNDTHEHYLNNGNRFYNISDIDYEINQYGYRTSKMTNNIFKENNIACFGCSNTFGTGLPWEETWPSVLNKLLGEDWSVKNYGVIAASNDMISRLIYNYTISHKPKIICCYLPEVFRMELYKEYSYDNFLPYGASDIEKNNLNKWEYYRAYRKIANEENSIYNFIKNYKFIEMICNLKNIKLYWGTWSDVIILSNINFKNEILNYNNYIGHDDIEKYIDSARDNLHFGKNTHNFIANKFYNKIIENL